MQFSPLCSKVVLRKQLIPCQDLLQVLVHRRLFYGIDLFIKFNADKIHAAHVTDVDTLTLHGASRHYTVSGNERNFD